MTISVDGGLFKPGHSIAHVLAENHFRIDFAQVSIVDSDERRCPADIFVPNNLPEILWHRYMSFAVFIGDHVNLLLVVVKCMMTKIFWTT